MQNPRLAVFRFGKVIGSATSPEEALRLVRSKEPALLAPETWEVTEERSFSLNAPAYYVSRQLHHRRIGR